MSKKVVVGFIAVFAVLSLAAGLLLSQSPPSRTGSRGDGSDESPLAWQYRLASQGLRQLRRARADGQQPGPVRQGRPRAVPVVMRRRIARNLLSVAPLHLHWAEARYAHTRRGIGIWVVEGRGLVCIFRDRSPATACDTRLNVGRRGIYVETYGLSKGRPSVPTAYRVLGIAPPGARTLRAESGGAFVVIPVANRTFEYRSNHPVRVILPGMSSREEVLRGG